MPIQYCNARTSAGLTQATKGYEKVHQEFGPQGSGKTIRANAMAEKLSNEGKHVLIVDDLWRNGEGGVQIWVKS